MNWLRRLGIVAGSYPDIDAVDLREAGLGHLIPALLASRHKTQTRVGGSAALTEGMIEHGGRLLTRTPLKRIVVERRAP